MNKYSGIFAKINIQLLRFNEFLDKNYKIKELDVTDAATYRDITNKVAYEDQDPWPNGEQSGVYILSGFKESNASQLGIYIGKASFGKIGKRLYTHLRKCSHLEYPTMKDSGGDTYILEYLTTIVFYTLAMAPFTSALEEYLITHLRSEVNLINSVGNSD